ncbi:glycosyltransferase [Kitasatospora sp. NPDC096147]|uniref:glycosyltransferase n=1 Tax=Kitasatospora sp. NPDC096147 TaxID=3364093 RepID=UPI003818CFB3
MAPRSAPSRTDGRAAPDVLARWRLHHVDPTVPAPVGDDLMALLARAEYGHGGGPRDGGEDGLPAEDLLTARLRRSARSGIPADPWWLVRAARGGPLQRGALTEAWAVAVRSGARSEATSALRSRLLLRLPPVERALLLDLAEEQALTPLTATECAAHAHGEDVRVRQAAWRYLSGVPDGADALPRARSAPCDPAEALLLAAAWERAEPGHPRGAGFRHAVAGLPAAHPAGVVVAQTMLLGRLEEPGAGTSGGMSVLVAALGDALTATVPVSRVLTLAPASGRDLAQGLVGRLGPQHWLLRVPQCAAAAGGSVTGPDRRAALAWWMTRLLGLPGARPAVVHARFADDGSLAVASAARRRRARLAFTATPDPHRMMTERHTGVRALYSEPAAALREDLHRVFAADLLTDRCELLVTIPGRTGTRELATHFPQLARSGTARPVVAPPEGIPPFVTADGDGDLAAVLLRRLFGGGDSGDGLDPGTLGLRMFLSVGRLHPVKQQDRLVEAWIEAGLHHRTTMLLVGGSASAATATEAEMRERIAKLVAGEPAARRNLACWPALPNRHVRLLERALAQGAPAHRTVYVCPSGKEEFGLAVLEAMEAGLTAAGPQRGGVGHYIDDGVNGFLLPTHSTPALAARLTELAALPPQDLARVASAGQRTVAGRFSAAAMAARLADAYHLLATGPAHR